MTEATNDAELRALMLQRQRLSGMYDEALLEAAEAKVDMEKAGEKLVQAYVEELGMDIAAARRRVRRRSDT